MKWMIAVLCLMLGQTSFAKTFKYDYKTSRQVNYQEQFYAPMSRSVMEACYKYTSTPQLEEYCNLINSHPEITKGCYYNTSSDANEMTCLRFQVYPDISLGCKEYTSTSQNEAICLEYWVSPYDAESCYRYTSTDAAEMECLRRHRRR